MNPRDYTKGNQKNYLKGIAIILSLLIITLPITLAEEFKRIYDGNGNLVSDGTYYREYSGFNQLIRIRQGNTSSSPVLEEYKWHPTEERIVIKRIFNNGVLNSTVYYPNENYVVIVNSSGTFKEKYVYQDGVLVAQVNTDGQKQAIHSDNEGSNTLITDSNGNVVENSFYSPFGETIEGGKNSRFGYEGKEYDSKVKDIDFKFRKYNPKIPIFNQPDTLIKNVYDPQSLNRYAFERNNPQKKVDPTGHCAEDGCLVETAAVAGGIIGGIYNTYIYLSSSENPNVGGASMHFGTGFVEGATSVIDPLLAIAGGATSKAVDKLSEGDKIDSWGDAFDVISAGVFNSAASFLGEKFLPKVGESRIKYLSSFFTTKTGQRFAENKLVENVGITYAQKAYNYFSNSFSLPNVNQISDNANRAQANSRESSNGGGSRSSVITADRSRVSKQISSAQLSGFIQISRGFASLASSLGVSVSSSNNRR